MTIAILVAKVFLTIAAGLSIGYFLGRRVKKSRQTPDSWE